MRQSRSMAVILSVVFVFALVSCTYAQDDAVALYKSKCQICHGPDGKGDTLAGKKVGAKDLHSPDVVKTADTALFDVVKKGKEKMPAYNGKLTDDQIKALIKYIRSLK